MTIHGSHEVSNGASQLDSIMSALWQEISNCKSTVASPSELRY